MGDFDHTVAFQTIDTQNEGILDFKNFTQEDFDGLVRRVDKSANGKISLIDFRAGLFPHEPKAAGQSSGYLAFSKGANASQYLHPQPPKSGFESAYYNRSNNFQSSSQNSAARANSRSAGSHDPQVSQYKGYLSPYRHEMTNLKKNRERQMASVLDQFLLDRAHREEFEGNSNSQSRSQRIRSPGVLKDASRQEKVYYNNKTESSPDKHSEANIDPNAEGQYDNSKQSSPENLQNSNNVAPRDYQTIDSEDLDKFRGRYLPQFDPLRDLHINELQYVNDSKVPTDREYTAAVPEQNYRAMLSASSHEATRDPRNQMFVQHSLRNAETSRRGSPVNQRNFSSLHDRYWNYNSHHNRSVVAAHPYADYVFPFDTLQSTKQSTIDNINSLQMQEYLTSIEGERIKGKRNKENDLKFTDHQSHYKGYYTQVRKGYINKFYDMSLVQRQKFFYNDTEDHDPKLYDGAPLQVRQPFHRGYQHHEPKQVTFQSLLRDPTYTLDKGYWPSSIRGSGMVSKYLHGKIEERKQLPIQRPEPFEENLEGYRKSTQKIKNQH